MYNSNNNLKDLTNEKDIKMRLNNALFSKEVSLFDNLLNTTDPKQVSLRRILYDIIKGTYAEEVSCSRQKLKISTKEYQDYNLSHIPVFTLSAKCSHRESDYKLIATLPKQLINRTGFLQIEILDLGTELEIVKDIIKDDKYTFFCYTSLSGDGLTIGIRIDKRNHYDSFKQLAKYYLETHNIKINPEISNLYSPCSISNDPELYVNTAAKVFVAEVEKINGEYKLI